MSGRRHTGGSRTPRRSKNKRGRPTKKKEVSSVLHDDENDKNNVVDAGEKIDVAKQAVLDAALKLKALEETVNDHKDVNKELVEQLNDHKDEIAKHERDKHGLKRKLDEHEERIQALTFEKEEALIEAEAAAETLKEEIEIAKTTITKTLKAEFDMRLNAEQERHDEEMEEIRSSMKLLQNERDSLQRKVDRFTRTLDNEREDTAKRIAELEEALDNNDNDGSRMVRLNEELQRKLQKKTDEANRLKDEIEDIKMNQNASNDINDDNQQELEDAKRQIRESATLIASLQSDIAHLKEKEQVHHRVLHETIRNKDEEHKRALDQYGIDDDQEDMIDQSYSVAPPPPPPNMSTHSIREEDADDSMNQLVEHLRSEIKAKDERIGILNDEITTLKDHINALNTEIGVLKQGDAIWTQRMEVETKQHYAAMEKRMDEIADLRTKVKIMEKEVEDICSELELTNSTNNTLSKSNEILNQHVEQLKSSSKDLSNEINELTDQFISLEEEHSEALENVNKYREIGENVAADLEKEKAAIAIQAKYRNFKQKRNAKNDRNVVANEIKRLKSQCNNLKDENESLKKDTKEQLDVLDGKSQAVESDEPLIPSTLTEGCSLKWRKADDEEKVDGFMQSTQHAIIVTDFEDDTNARAAQFTLNHNGGDDVVCWINIKKVEKSEIDSNTICITTVDDRVWAYEFEGTVLSEAVLTNMNSYLNEYRTYALKKPEFISVISELQLTSLEELENNLEAAPTKRKCTYSSSWWTCASRSKPKLDEADAEKQDPTAEDVNKDEEKTASIS